MKKLLNGLGFLGLIFCFGSTVLADDGDVIDSSSDSAGFVAKVKKSQGVILRVPINERGEENTAQAKMKLHVNGEKVKDLGTMLDAWDSAESIENQPVLSDDEVTDSSTYGWWGYRGRRWARPYHYYGYRPYYGYYGYNYTYANPVYYPAYGYRYYYYYGW